jgi:hypothetical protein
VLNEDIMLVALASNFFCALLPLKIFAIVCSEAMTLNDCANEFWL